MKTLIDFIEEIVSAGGKYAYLNGTPIIQDAYTVLHQHKEQKGEISVTSEKVREIADYVKSRRLAWESVGYKRIFDQDHEMVKIVLEQARYSTPARESGADKVIAAARCIRHWHDSANGGMIVSGEHVRALWDALREYDNEIEGGAS